MWDKVCSHAIIGTKFILMDRHLGIVTLWSFILCPYILVPRNSSTLLKALYTTLISRGLSILCNVYIALKCPRGLLWAWRCLEDAYCYLGENLKFDFTRVNPSIKISLPIGTYTYVKQQVGRPRFGHIAFFLSSLQLNVVPLLLCSWLVG